jgi:HTH-like domain
VARQKPRYGYRRLHALLSRRGHAVNVKRVSRLYVEEGLTVRRRKRKRLVRPPASRRVALRRKSRISSWSAMMFLPFFFFFCLVTPAICIWGGTISIACPDVFNTEKLTATWFSHFRTSPRDVSKLLVLPFAPIRRVDALLLLVLEFECRWRRSRGRSRAWASSRTCYCNCCLLIPVGRRRRCCISHQEAAGHFVIEQEINWRRTAVSAVIDELKETCWPERVEISRFDCEASRLMGFTYT